MTFGAPYPIDTDAIAEWNAANQRARDAYQPPSDLCADCQAAPRYRASSYCNPCRNLRAVRRKAGAA